MKRFRYDLFQSELNRKYWKQLMSQDFQDCEGSNKQPIGSYAVGKVINLHLEINEWEFSRSKSQMANSIDMPATFSPPAQPMKRTVFDGIDTRSLNEQRNPSFFSNVKNTGKGIDLDRYEQELDQLQANYHLQPGSAPSQKNVSRNRRQSAYVKSRLPTFGSLKTPKPVAADIERLGLSDMPCIPESGTTHQPDNQLNHLPSHVNNTHHDHRISQLDSSLQGSFDGFRPPLSQLSDGVEVDSVATVIAENAKLDEQLADLFKTYCDKFQPFTSSNHRSGVSKAKNTLRKVRNICTQAWLKDEKRTLVGFKYPPLPQRDNSSGRGESSDENKPMGRGLTKAAKQFPGHRGENSTFNASEDKNSSELNSTDFEVRQEQERVVALVNLNKRINYLARKKGELQGPIQELRANISKLRKEKAELKPIYETYEFQTYADLQEEMQSLMNSGEYQDNCMKDPNHYLVVAVAQMKSMAPGLKRYEQLKQLYGEDLLKVTELEYIYKATCEDLERLRLSEKYLLDSSFEGRGHDLSVNGSVVKFGTNMNLSSDLPYNGSNFGTEIKNRHRQKTWGNKSASAEDEISANGSVSIMSRNSQMPLVHVENYFQKSTSSFNN